MDQEKIGAFIRDVRKETGLTQEQFAEKLGVSQRSVSRWETGKTMPDYSLLPGICEVLGINVAELLGAERIEGDSVSKKQVTAMTGSIISIINDRKNIRRIVGAVISAIVMLACMIGLYSCEFSVAAESTADLENAINEYHFHEEISADVLERQAIGNRLYVLYGEKDFPGACGLACLEKGIFGKYRFISCNDSDHRWINVSEATVKGTKYCITYCVNELSGIDSYGICGIKNEADQELELICRLDYDGSPFLKFTAVDNGTVISSFYTKYYHGNEEIRDAELEEMLGEYTVDGAPSSGYGTAELGMLYVLEAILLLLGFVFIRYFLSEVRWKREE